MIKLYKELDGKKKDIPQENNGGGRENHRQLSCQSLNTTTAEALKQILYEASKTNIQKQIFAIWTGIDESVYESLENTDKLWESLIKELSIIAELGKEGAAKKLILLLDNAITNQESYSAILNDFNALVEYGDFYSALSPEEQNNVLQHEIQEEFGHFWRIMGIESMKKKENNCGTKKIVGEIDDVMNLAGNLVRELGVIIERRQVRRVMNDTLPVKMNSEPEGNIKLQSLNALGTTRSQYPYVSAFISVKTMGSQAVNNGQAEEKELDTNKARQYLNLFNRLLIKFPLEKAVALLDYIIFKNEDLNEDLHFMAMQQFCKNGKQYLKLMSIGQQIILHTKMNNDFTHELKRVIRGKDNNFFGGLKPCCYQTKEWEVDLNDNIFFLSADFAEKLKGLNDEDILKVLNQKGKNDKILPVNNLRKYAKISSNGILSINCKPKEEFNLSEFTKNNIEEQIKPLMDILLGLNQKPLKIAIEGAHIHADREVSQSQRIGARIAGVLANMLNFSNIEALSAPMIDDNHVVNALDYEKFEEMLEEEGYNISEIIFESSPLIYELSLDILKFLIDKHPDKIKIIGNNLYLEVDNMMIELIQDFKNEFITGCVLFDAGLCLYKLYPSLLKERYKNYIKNKKHDSVLADEDIHEVILQIYKKTKKPEERLKNVKKLLPENNIDLAELYKNCQCQPFLNVIQDKITTDTSQKDQYIVMILEETYHSQQNKLSALMGLLGLIEDNKIITVMFNQETGQITHKR